MQGFTLQERNVMLILKLWRIHGAIKSEVVCFPCSFIGTWMLFGNFLNLDVSVVFKDSISYVPLYSEINFFVHLRCYRNSVFPHSHLIGICVAFSCLSKNCLLYAWLFRIFCSFHDLGYNLFKIMIDDFLVLQVFFNPVYVQLLLVNFANDSKYLQ